MNFFKLFPKSTSTANRFLVNTQKLRKEYRQLQQIYHPDRINTLQQQENAITQPSNTEITPKTSEKIEIDSQLLNRAYTTLRSPLSRAQHILQLEGFDVSSENLKTHDNEFLMEILEIHDDLENAATKGDIDSIRSQNDTNLKNIEEQLTKYFADGELEKAKDLVIKLRYYTNIEKAVENWQPGKPITLSH